MPFGSRDRCQCDRLGHRKVHAILYLPTATAESTKALTGLVTVNNANKIATRLVYDTLRVELVWANRIEGAPMPRHQITPALR